MPTCAKGSSVLVMGNAVNGVFLGFMVSSWCLVHMESFSPSRLPCCAQDLGYIGVPPAGHALWAEVGGGITFVTPGEKTSKFIKQPSGIMGFVFVL